MGCPYHPAISWQLCFHLGKIHNPDIDSFFCKSLKEEADDNLYVVHSHSSSQKKDQG